MKILIASLSFMLVLVGCGSDTTSDGTVDTTTETLAFSDVHAVLKTKCLACHGTNGTFTLGSATAPLAEAEAYDNVLLFTGLASAADSILLQKATGGLSHGGGEVFDTSSYEYIITSAWIEAGSSLDVSFDVNTTATPTSNPGYDLPTVDASTFTKDHYMNNAPVQGQACIACHQAETGGDIIRFGGTLSSYIYTPDGQYYQDLSGYSVNIVGNMGSDFSASANSSTSTTGHNNFYELISSDFLSGELFTVYVKDSGGNIVNQSGTNTHSSLTHTDCNSCHTKDGINNAPGRVLVPLVN